MKNLETMRQAIVICALIVVLPGFLSLVGCASLTQRQQLVASTTLFSAAVDGVESAKKAGKLSGPELAAALIALQEAEKGLDKWRDALEMYESKVNAALKASITATIQRVLAQVLLVKARP